MQLQIDWLKNNHLMVHYFGLGFIQLKLSNEKRLHFYTQELPQIVSGEEIHSHRYNFTSEILCGEMVQEMFAVGVGDTHLIEEESCKPDVDLGDTGGYCAATPLSKHISGKGSSYWIHHTAFHRVAATDCVTLVTRSNIQQQMAQVVRPVGGEKVCPFSKKVDEKDLWAIIDSMLQKHHLGGEQSLTQSVA
jgi:hypothetical protein